MTNWPEPLTITLIGGMIVTVIGSIVTGIVAVITALRVTVVSRQQELTRGDLLTVAKDTETIKGHVNSEKTAAEGRETALKMENLLLREQLAQENVTKRLLAQAAALVPALATVPQDAGVVPQDRRAEDRPRPTDATHTAKAPA